MRCLYCDEEKSDFSKEHIIPKAIGGGFEPENPFLIKNVCERCNNIAGLYIDAPFTKNWFVNNSRALNAKRFVNLNTNPILPLQYFGQLSNLTFEDKICEYWQGPTGDGIYHFHEPYPSEENVGIAGKPLNKKIKIDHGFVFLLVRSNNPEWHPSIIFSVLENFKGSIFYLGNGVKPNLEEFKEIPQNLKSLHKEILGLNKKSHNCKMSISIGFEERFLAKVALGLGCKLLNPSFISGANASLLRKFMKEKNSVKRSELGIRFTSMIPKVDGHDFDFMKDLTTWPGGHTLLLLPIGEMLSLWVNFYELHTFGIIITDQKSDWEGKINKEGIMYILAPGLKKIVGPINLNSLIAHRHDENYEDKKLKDLELMMEEHSVQPKIML